MRAGFSISGRRPNGHFVDVMARDVFIKSIELVMMGETIFLPEFMSFVLGSEGDPAPRDENNQETLIRTERTLAPQLSTREKSILRCLIEGDSNKCIARKIDIAEATVKVHVKAILRKIRVQNRTQAAIWGMNNGSRATTGKQQLPAFNLRCEQAASKSGRGDLRDQANGDIGTAGRDRARCNSC